MKPAANLWQLDGLRQGRVSRSQACPICLRSVVNAQEHTRSSSAAATYTLFRWVKPGRTKLFEVPLSYIIAEEDIPRPNVYGPRFVLQKGV